MTYIRKRQEQNKQMSAILQLLKSLAQVRVNSDTTCKRTAIEQLSKWMVNGGSQLPRRESGNSQTSKERRENDPCGNTCESETSR